VLYSATIVLPSGGAAVTPFYLPDAYPRHHETHYDFLKRWEEDYAAGRETIEPPRNIRLKHDPRWRYRFLSIQCAHDLNHPVWRAAHVFTQATMLPSAGFQFVPLVVV
jgi:hypothetical protein